jgi:hypothetical protein
MKLFRSRVTPPCFNSAMTNVMSIAASGMQSAMRSFGDAAAAVVSAGFPTAPAAAATTSGMLNAPPVAALGDLAEPMVDALQAANAFRANLAVFQIGQQMSRAMLDSTA